MSSKGDNIIIGLIYRHPKRNDITFLNYLKETYKTLKMETLHKSLDLVE